MPATNSLRVLIVEDDEAIATILAAFARSRGHVAIVARDGAAALLKAATTSPDVVLLDVQLPKLDGRDVCGELKRCPATAGIPVIAMAGRGDDPHLRRLLLGLGAADVLAKPLRIEETFRLIERIANRRHDQLSLFT